MKIVLLSLYNLHSYAIRGFHSFLKNRGYDVESVYFKTSTYTDGIPAESEIAQVVEFLKSRNPDVIAVSIHSPVFPIFRRISMGIREKIGCKIIVGGEHPTALPDDCLLYADYVVVGEGENALIDLAEGRLQEGIVIPNEFENLDDLDFPWYGDGTHSCSVGNTKVTHSYLSSRGCPFRCAYCTESIRECSLRRKSVDKVVEDTKRLVNMFDLGIVFFSDSIFTLNRKWLEEFCDKFSRLNLKFQCYGHPVCLDNQVISMLKEAGCEGIRMGVQSGSGSMRSKFNRKEKLDDILRAATLIHHNKISSSYDFIINNPYDDGYSLKETRDFIGKLPPYVGINCFELRWFPSTPMTNMALRDGYILPRDVEGQYSRFGHWDYSYMKGT